MKTQGKPHNPAIKTIELLAPAGSIEAGYAALHYGADAIYLGLSDFSARAAATNFTIEEMADITGYAHSLPKLRKIYVAVNTLIRQNELGTLIDLLAAIANAGADAVIVQDLGVLGIMRRHFPRLKAHASTQMAVHNRYGAETANSMGMARVTLARELTLEEIAGITATPGIETEVFVHGALCYSYSGLCLFSSHVTGRSGNRGKCAYPCREWFKPELSERADNSIGEEGGFVFSMKDLALPNCVTGLERVGVTALKIEGRMKSPLYVAAAVNYYRHLIDGNMSPGKERELASDLKTIFSRPWTDLYIKTRVNRGVTDIETQGHRGSPAGKVEEVAKNAGGHSLRFKTALPLELHDGLQVDIAGLPRPFGFAVKSINIIGDRRIPEKKRVFTAPPGAKVEIQLPRGHPVIPLGAVIYSSSSQKVKQQYDFFTPKPHQFRFRHSADFDIHVDSKNIDVTASVNVFPGTKGRPAAIEVKKHFEGLFRQAINRGDEAYVKSFSKLGNTNLMLGKLTVDNPHNLFVPISLLNSIRRDIAAQLEREMAGMQDKSTAEIKTVQNAILPGAGSAKPVHPGENADKQGNFNWSIKTDQPDVLAAFGPEDGQKPDEVIIELTGDFAPNLPRHIEILSSIFGKEHIRFSLPPIMRQWEIPALEKTVSDLISMDWRKWQVSNMGGLAFLHAFKATGGITDISADWPLYVVNRAAVQQLHSMGIRRFTLSPEDGLENMRGLLKEFAADATVIAYQDTPLMISETCIFASGKCHAPIACKFKEATFTSAHGDKIRVVNRGCRLAILNHAPFCLAAHQDELAQSGARNLRIDFINRQYSKTEALEVWRRMRSGAKTSSGHIANFKRGLG